MISLPLLPTHFAHSALVPIVALPNTDAPDMTTVEVKKQARPLRFGILLSLLAMLPYVPTLRAQFIYDDSSIIRDNVMLRGWGAIVRVWSTPYWPVEGADALGLYRPLQLSLLSTVWNLGGGAAVWFHLYALLLSVAATLGVWWLLRRGVGDVAAVIGAAWFAVHPLHVEVIASVANTSEIVVVLCTIGMVAVLARWEASPNDRPRDWLRAGAFGVLAAAALAAKESGLLAVIIALVTAWGWHRRTTPAQFFRDNSRAMLSAVAGVTMMVLARLAVLGAPISHASIAAQGLSSAAPLARITSMLSLWPRIAGMLAWPAQLAPYYGSTIFPASRHGLALMSAIIASALVALAMLAAWRGERRPLVALAWIILSYLPASNLLAATGQILSDRVLFGATVGVAMLLAFGLDLLSGLVRTLMQWLVIGAIAWSTVVGAHYAIAWTSHRTLWERLAEVEPNEHLSYKLLGMDARARGDTAHAVMWLERALAMMPADRQIRFEYGQALYGAGRYGAAVRALAPLLHDEDARGEAGFIALYLDAVGRAGGPQAVLDAALPLRHSSSGAVASLYAGVAYEELGRRAEAESVFVAALRRVPGDSALRGRLDVLRASRPRGAP